MHSFFAVSPPGLEGIVASELGSLDLELGAKVPGGVEWRGSFEDLYRANLWARTPNRLLVRLGDFQATSFVGLFNRAARLDWDRWINPDAAPVRLRVSTKKSRLYHSGAVAERIQQAMTRRVPGLRFITGEAEESKGAAFEQLVLVRLEWDRVFISIDSSGDLLFRRGYRQQTAKAPIRENLAAALLMHAGWTGEGALIDPFCGSGTLAIEAAEIALGLAAGRQRRFAFEAWPNLDVEALARQRERAEAGGSARMSGPPPSIFASDRVQGAIGACIGNVTRAGVLEQITLGQHDFFSLQPPTPGGLFVANLPYGQRVTAGKKPSRLLARIRAQLKERWPLWRGAVIVPSRLRGFPGSPGEDLNTDNGGISVCFRRFMPVDNWRQE
jgi:putative N6-adenine-specific DNA methylase